MTEGILEAHGLVAIDGNRVAVIVEPPEDMDLEFIYRAALSVYWNSARRQLEDRYTGEVSQVASFRRIARAVKEECGLRFKPTEGFRWEGISEDARKEIARDLT